MRARPAGFEATSTLEKEGRTKEGKEGKWERGREREWEREREREGRCLVTPRSGRDSADRYFFSLVPGGM